MLRISIGALLLASALASLPAMAEDKQGLQPSEPVTNASPSPAAGTPAAATPAPATASETSEPAVTPAATSDQPASLADPVPDVAKPDPLTPAKADEGPVAAPGAPSQAAAPPSIRDAVDPVVIAARAQLAARPEIGHAGDKTDLQALETFYAEAGTTPIWTATDGLSPRGLAVVAAIKRADTFGLEAEAFELPAPPIPGSTPEARAEAEVRLGLAVLKYARHARGGRIDPPALSQMIDMRPRLYEPKSVLSAIAAAPAADVYLEGLNPQHQGFKALREALTKVRAEASAEPEAKRKSADDNIGRIIVNMERWRWLPDDLGPFYVWDNVGEQYTRVVHDGKVVLKEKIVVGKPSSPTPIFSAPMRFVIFHPSWGVPEGIKTKELAPMLRRAQSNSSGWFFSENDGASRALRRHELKVYRGGREVNPDSINWSSVDPRQFTFTQPPSSRNVLGVVKFRFPNRFDVYMHDTSERHLFSRGARAFSHGCMRVENPLHLAETILAYDKGWSKDRIAALAARGSTTDVTLEKAVPVHIVNFTATVDEDGKLHTHSDIYGIDSRVASALAGRSVTLASARSTAETAAESASQPRRKEPAKRQAKRQSTAAAGAGSPASRPFSPFGGFGGN